MDVKKLVHQKLVHQIDRDGDFIALCDLLKTKGLCQTGGHAKMSVAQGQVKVDGEVELRKRRKIRAGHLVEFRGCQIKVI